MLGRVRFLAYRPTLAEERAFQSKLTAFTRESQQLSAEEMGSRQKAGRKARTKRSRRPMGPNTNVLRRLLKSASL